MILKRAIAVFTAAAIGFAVMVAAALPVRAQSGNGPQFVPLGYCQMTGFTSATKLTPATCPMASVTATGNGSLLNVTAVASGRLAQYQQISGTGVPPNTFIMNQVSGTPGGVGIYATNGPTTVSAGTVTAGGVPLGATRISFTAEAQALRYRDDNQAPTTTVGMPIAVAQTLVYQGSLIDLQFIAQVSGSINDVSFYK